MCIRLTQKHREWAWTTVHTTGRGCAWFCEGFVVPQLPPSYSLCLCLSFLFLQCLLYAFNFRLTRLSIYRLIQPMNKIIQLLTLVWFNYVSVLFHIFYSVPLFCVFPSTRFDVMILLRNFLEEHNETLIRHHGGVLGVPSWCPPLTHVVLQLWLLYSFRLPIEPTVCSM